MFSQKFGLRSKSIISQELKRVKDEWKQMSFLSVSNHIFFQPSLACVLLFCSFCSCFELSLPQKYSCQNRSWGGRLLSYTSEIDICPPVPSDLAPRFIDAAGGHGELFLLQGFAYAWRPAQPLVWRQWCINFWDGLKQTPRKLCFCLYYPFRVFVLVLSSITTVIISIEKSWWEFPSHLFWKL